MTDPEDIPATVLCDKPMILCVTLAIFCVVGFWVLLLIIYILLSHSIDAKHACDEEVKNEMLKALFAEAKYQSRKK